MGLWGLLGPRSAPQRSITGSKPPGNVSSSSPNVVGSFLGKLDFSHFQTHFGPNHSGPFGGRLGAKLAHGRTRRAGNAHNRAQQDPSESAATQLRLGGPSPTLEVCVEVNALVPNVLIIYGVKNSKKRCYGARLPLAFPPSGPRLGPWTPPNPNQPPYGTILASLYWGRAII